MNILKGIVYLIKNELSYHSEAASLFSLIRAPYIREYEFKNDEGRVLRTVDFLKYNDNKKHIHLVEFKRSEKVTGLMLNRLSLCGDYAPMSKVEEYNGKYESSNYRNYVGF